MSDHAYPQPDPVPNAAASSPDPLVTAADGGFGGWLEKVREVVARSWLPVLIISLVGIALPFAVISVTADMTGVADYLSANLADANALARGLLRALAGLLVTIAVIVGVGYVVSASWAAGCWAIVRQARTARRISLVEAFRYGFGRAFALWPWTLAVGAIVALGLASCVLPGVYAGYACGMFGFVAVFERGTNPVLRSIGLTHGQIGVGLSRIVASFVPYAVYKLVSLLILATTFRVIFGIGTLTGTTTTAGTAVLHGMMVLVDVVLAGPAVAAIMFGLFVTYAELRANEVPLSTSTLAAAL